MPYVAPTTGNAVAGSAILASDMLTVMNDIIDHESRILNTGLVYVTGVSIGSSVTTVAIPNAFSATYTAYRVVLTTGTMASSNHVIGYRLGSSTTRTDYAHTGSNNSSVGAIGVDYNTAATYAQIGYTSTQNGSYVTDILNPYLARYTQFNTLWGLNTTGSTRFSGNVNAVDNTATSYTDLNLYSVDAITGGKIVVYGYTNS